MKKRIRVNKNDIKAGLKDIRSSNCIVGTALKRVFKTKEIRCFYDTPIWGYIRDKKYHISDEATEIIGGVLYGNTKRLRPFSFTLTYEKNI